MHATAHHPTPRPPPPATTRHHPTNPPPATQLSERRLGNFVEALQAFHTHPEFGPRILVFGILCGAIVYEDDEKGFGSSQSVRGWVVRW